MVAGLVAIFRKREYQPWRVQYVLDKCCVKFATSLLSRSNCGLNNGGKRRLMIEIKVMHPAGHAYSTLRITETWLK